MLKYTDYDVVFREVPDEVTLAINLSNCPHRCRGCHSPQLQQDIGEELDERALSLIVERYLTAVTCVCFMGGDADSQAVGRLANFVKKRWGGQLKTAWYSGNNELYNKSLLNSFDFIKIGEYIETLGGLDKSTTNQRLYRVVGGDMIECRM